MYNKFLFFIDTDTVINPEKFLEAENFVLIDRSVVDSINNMNQKLDNLENEVLQTKVQNIKLMLLLEKMYKSLPNAFESTTTINSDKNENINVLSEYTLPLTSVENVSRLNKTIITNISFKETFVSIILQLHLICIYKQIIIFFL